LETVMGSQMALWLSLVLRTMEVVLWEGAEAQVGIEIPDTPARPLQE
jgi:hypothetical protein